jgi:hypothetical protein
MRRLLTLLAGLVLVVVALQSAAASSSEQRVLEFDTMAPVMGPFVGNAHPIRGVNGGGLPWQIAEGKGDLTTSGQLDVEVRGLVLLDAAPVPEDLRGINPIPTFRAIVSCLTIVNGNAATRNVVTGPFPASRAGDSEIRATIGLPNPCFAPIIFVGPNATTWFAVTGR